LLVEDTFVHCESVAILKYLAGRAQSPAYPADLRDRARVDAAIDWFMTNLHAALGSSLAYPTLYPAMKPLGEQAYRARSCRHPVGLAVLDKHMIGPDRTYVGGEDLTLADYVGSSVIVLAEAINIDLRPFPNVLRWLDAMKARPSWQPTYAAFTGLMIALRPAA
jgi:glutathione S-transferase